MTPSEMRNEPNSQDGVRLRIAYVVSMASGLHSFVYREVRELVSLGVDVRLFPTQIGPGPYAPMADWPVDQPTPLGLIRGHARFLRTQFRKYIGALWEAFRFHALTD